MMSQQVELRYGLRVYAMRRGPSAPWPTKLDKWLARCELEELCTIRALRRRNDWLSGRWCAKRLLAQNTSCGSLAEWQILSRKSANVGCRPRVLRNNVPQSMDLSLSHSTTTTVAVAAGSGAGRIGVDVVTAADLPDSFANAWFSPRERQLLETAHVSLAAAWSAKEAAFKACNSGEPFRPRRLCIIDVSVDGCRVRYEAEQMAGVQFTRIDHAVVALARAENAAPLPTTLWMPKNRINKESAA